MCPFVILKRYYEPSKPWKAWRVGRDLTKLVRDLGFVPIDDPHHRHQVKAAWCSVPLVAYVRRRTVRNPKAAQWHQDGDLDPGDMDNALVLWSSNTPTEVQDLNGKIWPVPERAVICFNNLDCYHRRPPNAPKVRWLFRQRVERM